VSDLARFAAAQNDPLTGIGAALAELRAGRKTGHWIWYVFPQVAGLGRSGTSQRYAIADASEAIAYLEDDVLRARLIDSMQAVLDAHDRGVSLADVMGSSLDARKLISSMTLFHDVAMSASPTPRREAFPRVAQLAGRILLAAERAGIPACAFTRQAIRSL
jgi:uncharacterized protein (DUF1810 family)